MFGCRDAEIRLGEDRVLITLDSDFADIRAYPPDQYPGIIVLRLNRQDKFQVMAILARLIQSFPTERIRGHLWILEEERIRISGQ